jgi:hypothetical protein
VSHFRLWVIFRPYFLQCSSGSPPRYPASTIMYVLYGHEVSSHDDPLVRIAFESLFAFSGSVFPGQTMLNIFPAREFKSFYICYNLTSYLQFDICLPGFLDWGSWTNNAHEVVHFLISCWAYPSSLSNETW